jgi:hypothetical protein
MTKPAKAVKTHSYSKDQVQICVQSFVDGLAGNSNVIKRLLQCRWSLLEDIHFMEGGIHLFRVAIASKLYAQTTSKRPKCRHQHRSPVLAVQRHVALRKNIVAIRYRLPVAKPKPR